MGKKLYLHGKSINHNKYLELYFRKSYQLDLQNRNKHLIAKLLLFMICSNNVKGIMQKCHTHGLRIEFDIQYL